LPSTLTLIIMDKVEFLANNVEAEGKRAYLVEGRRVVFPSDWTDEERDAWIQKAKKDTHLKRPLRMIKKDGSTSLLRAYRKI